MPPVYNDYGRRNDWQNEKYRPPTESRELRNKQKRPPLRVASVLHHKLRAV
jgi:hypothetical protein